MSRILVTGGAGFIGSHLCEVLADRHHLVTCFDNLSTGNSKNINHINLENFIQGDANNYKDLERAFRGDKIDRVFHYAAVCGVKRTLENPLLVLKDVAGIYNILDLSVKYGIEKVVFSSSSEVYGNPVEIPEVEDGHINAKLPYAAVKLIGENFMKAYYQQHKLKTCSLRFFNVYGPRQDGSAYGFVSGIFIEQVLGNKSPTIFNDGTQTRDFVYIDDNIEAAIRAMESDKTNGEVINVGTGKPITITDLAETVIKLCGKEGQIEPVYLAERREDVMHRFPNVSKMLELLEFRPKIKLEDGLKKTIEWYKTKN